MIPNFLTDLYAFDTYSLRVVFEFREVSNLYSHGSIKDVTSPLLVLHHLLIASLQQCTSLWIRTSS